MMECIWQRKCNNRINRISYTQLVERGHRATPRLVPAWFLPTGVVQLKAFCKNLFKGQCCLRHARAEDETAHFDEIPSRNDGHRLGGKMRALPKVSNGRLPTVGTPAAHSPLQPWFSQVGSACETTLRAARSVPNNVALQALIWAASSYPMGPPCSGFRTLPNDNELGESLFVWVGQVMQRKAFKINAGNVVDANI